MNIKLCGNGMHRAEKSNGEWKLLYGFPSEAVTKVRFSSFTGGCSFQFSLTDR